MGYCAKCMIYDIYPLVIYCIFLRLGSSCSYHQWDIQPVINIALLPLPGGIIVTARARFSQSLRDEMILFVMTS